MSRDDWVGMIILRELCRELKFDHIDIWYVYKPETDLKMKQYSLGPRNTNNHPIQAKKKKTKKKLVLLKTKICHQIDFWKEGKKLQHKYEGDSDGNHSWSFWNIYEGNVGNLIKCYKAQKIRDLFKSGEYLGACVYEDVYDRYCDRALNG